MSEPAPCPIAFLASELAETSRLTTELARSAGGAVESLAAHLPAGADRGAIDRLMVALQAQDRVQQRLARLEAYARAFDGRVAAGVAHDALADALQLDELVRAFERHLGRAADAADDSRDDVELF
jgi:hypothetical protein